MKGNFIKKILTVGICVGLMTGITSASYAAPVAPGFTGWEYSTGAPLYYLGGVKAVNTWAKFGNVIYYLGADGYMVPQYAVTEEGLKNLGGGSYIDTNNGGALCNVTSQAAEQYKAVREIYNVTNDYEAFKRRYPGYVTAYAGNEQAIYNAYLASYNGATPGNKYIGEYDKYLNTIYNAHIYNHHYDSYYNGTHKAYCECGAWIMENCDRVDTSVGGPYRCSKCGALYNADDTLYEEDDD